MSARAGIPKALLFHRYSSLWEGFLRNLGLDIVSSASTNEGILREGLRNSVSDLCLPVKAALGHVSSLRESVDFIFMPRIISVEKDSYMCPKLIGLPDVVRACLGNLPPIIDAKFNMKEPKCLDTFASDAGRTLGIRKKTVLEAFLDAERKAQTPETNPPKQGMPNIGISGRPYLSRDAYLSCNILRKLKDMGVNPVTVEPSQSEIEACMGMLPKWVYWSLGKEAVTSAWMFFGDPAVDGVINIATAACGPDSFTGELIKRLHLRCAGKPYMSIYIDEHTADAGIRTRIEAFVDMMTAAGRR